MPDASDTELLQDYSRQNSEEAFAELARRHVNLVYSAALRHVGIAAHAEEITQAVFVILARKAAGLRADTILDAWLYETTRLTALSFLRGERRRQFREQEAYMQSTLLESTDDVVIWNQLAPLLDEAMARLGRKDREAVVLRFFKEKNLGEVAAAMKVTESAAQRRVHRAVEKLRTFFAKRGVDSTAATIGKSISANSIQAAPIALAKTATAVALAKGATASTSTLTLIKGALKIMAWTKAKTAIVVGTTAIVLTLGVGYFGFFHQTHSKQAGKLKLPVGNVTPMIAYGYSHDVIILASDGSLWSWGEERLGWPVLGLTNIHNTVSLRRIGNDTDWVSIAVGDSQNLAIKSDGTLWGWGENLYYQLGDGTKITRPTPVPSIPGNDWKQAATGSSSFALKNDGTLWAWGNNWAGQLGIGSTKATTNAVQVGTSTNWTKIWGGDIQSVGLQSDGSLWFWGSLTGSSKDTNKFLVPTRISPDTNWVDICFGYFTVLALKSDGTLWAFGLDADIYTDAPDKNLNATPEQIGTENDWQSISSSPGSFCHILRKRDGSLWALDASEHRTIKPASEYKPVALKKIDFNKDIAAYAAGGDNIGIILTRDGEVWTWGNVIGEHSPKAFVGPNRQQLFPKYKVIDKPWQVSISDATN